MHYLQKNILDQLRSNSGVKYSELHPKHLESSHFRYHLLQLENDGYILKKDKIYELTIKGKSFVDRLSSDGVGVTQMPKVITYTLLHTDSEYLLHNKQKEPYKDLLNLIGGKVHYNELSHEAAEREVKEKTNQAVANLKYCGTAEIRISYKEELLSHVVAFIYSKEVSSSTEGLVPIKKESLENHINLAPDCLKLIQQINLGKTFSTKIDCSL